MLLRLFRTLFSSIFNMFGSPSHTAHATAKSSNTDGPAIAYYPQLIQHLEMDHQQLLSLYMSIGEAVALKQYSHVAVKLNTFRQDFQAHLDAENIKFYGYLEQSLKDQSQEFASLRRFRKEMRTIERTVLKFLDHWIDMGVDANSAVEFKTQYDAIGAALVKRIESEEEELYTLYAHA